MLSPFEYITCSSSLPMEEIKLFAIVNWIFPVSDFLRLFTMSFKFGLILLKFNGFEVKENESKEECDSKVKSYIKNCLSVDIEESDFNRIHRIEPKINKNGKAFQ